MAGATAPKGKNSQAKEPAEDDTLESCGARRRGTEEAILRCWRKRIFQVTQTEAQGFLRLCFFVIFMS